MTDADTLEALCTIRALQTALDHAHARLRDAEATIATLNARLTTANERCRDLEFHGKRRSPRSDEANAHAGQNDTGDALASWDVSPESDLP